MLYVIPASSALHFDAQPRYHCRQPPFLGPYYDGYHSGDMAEVILKEEALRRYTQEQLLRRRQAQEVTRRRLLQSIYAAERKRQKEMEYARAVAIVAARHRQIEDSIRRNTTAKIFLRQPGQDDIQERLFALLSHGGADGSAQPEQTPASQVPALQRTPAVRRPVPYNPVADKLKSRLRGEHDPEVAETLRSVLGALFSDQPQATGVEPSPSPDRQDKGKGKASAGDVVDPKPEPEVKTLERAIQEYLEDFFRPVPRPGEAGPSGTSSSEPAVEKEKHVSFEEAQKPGPSTPTSKSSIPEPTTTDSEAQDAERARTQALSSIQQIKTTLNTLESEFHLPVTLDHYPTSPLDNDDTASVSSTASDLSRLLPYTSNNAIVHAYENKLGTLLERLDGVESGGDSEVRQARKEVVRDVEKALSAVEDEITKRVELAGESTPVPESRSEEVVGYSVDDAIVEADLEVPSTRPALEIVAPAAETPVVQFTDTESGVGETLDAHTSGERPDLTLEPLSILPSEAAEETSVGSLPDPRPSDIFVEPIYHSPLAEEVTVVETPSEDQVEEVDTFLLAAPQPVSPAVGNISASDETEDEVDGAVVIDAGGDEWLEV